MPTNINFMGKEYTTVEEMPPQVRQAYEVMKVMAQKFPDTNADNEFAKLISAGQIAAQRNNMYNPTTPAWGNPTAQGKVSLPTVFESITDLGAASDVYQAKRTNISGMIVVLIFGFIFMAIGLMIAFFGFDPDDIASALIPGFVFGGIGGFLFLLGIWNLWSLFRGIQALVLFRDGFAYSRSGRGVQSWRWTEIATVLSKETFVTGKRSSWTDRTYTIQKKSGEKVILENYQLENIVKIAASIKQNSYALLLPPLTVQYNLGQAVIFGPVTISRDLGIQIKGKLYAWDKIQEVAVKDGSLVITMKDSSLLSGRHKVRASTIPNVEMLCQIVGVNPMSIDLVYR